MDNKIKKNLGLNKYISYEEFLVEIYGQKILFNKNLDKNKDIRHVSKIGSSLIYVSGYPDLHFTITENQYNNNGSFHFSVAKKLIPKNIDYIDNIPNNLNLHFTVFISVFEYENKTLSIRINYNWLYKQKNSNVLKYLEIDEKTKPYYDTLFDFLKFFVNNLEKNYNEKIKIAETLNNLKRENIELKQKCVGQIGVQKEPFDSNMYNNLFLNTNQYQWDSFLNYFKYKYKIDNNKLKRIKNLSDTEKEKVLNIAKNTPIVLTLYKYNGKIFESYKKKTSLDKALFELSKSVDQLYYDIIGKRSDIIKECKDNNIILCIVKKLTEIKVKKDYNKFSNRYIINLVNNYVLAVSVIIFKYNKIIKSL